MAILPHTGTPARVPVRAADPKYTSASLPSLTLFPASLASLVSGVSMAGTHSLLGEGNKMHALIPPNAAFGAVAASGSSGGVPAARAVAGLAAIGANAGGGRERKLLQPDVKPTDHPCPKRHRPLLLRLIVLRKILLLNDGRDKVLKIVQYAAKVLLWTRLLSAVAATQRTPSAEKALSAMVPHISLARKLVRFGASLGPLEFLFTETHSITSSHIFKFLANINDLFTSLADDSVTLGKIGVINPNPFFGTWADRLWLVGIGFDSASSYSKLKEANIQIYQLKEKKRVLELQASPLDDQHVDGRGSDAGGVSTASTLESIKMKLSNAQKQAWMCQISLAKLAADSIFCSFDVFGVVKRVEKAGGPHKQLQMFQDVSALVAACLGTWKLCASVENK
ncbi:hypothetical protein HDU84_002540 [Entophlyctis sp. JEL0112]|nr:hypothetical protein HDU84_002540 [Entophlyctis sp. JEL0112]